MKGIRHWRDIAVIEFDSEAHATLQKVSLRPLSDGVSWQGHQVFLLARPRDGQLFVFGPKGLPDQVVEAVVETHKMNSDWAQLSVPASAVRPMGGVEL